MEEGIVKPDSAVPVSRTMQFVTAIGAAKVSTSESAAPGGTTCGIYMFGSPVVEHAAATAVSTRSHDDVTY